MGRRPSRAVIFGCQGAELTPGERWFFREAQPWGFILFARNCINREQVRRLVADLRASVDDPFAPVLIDQEGGRVARLKAPEWPEFPPAATFGSLYRQNPDLAREALGLNTRLLAHELRDLGITVDCLPVADVPAPDEHGIIGDRAYGSSAALVGDMARQAADSLLAHGVLPVVKHLPGHGRARVDSHEALPVVEASRADLEAIDFAAFEPVKDMPLGMTAHVVYSAIDPAACATQSPTVIRDIIRGHIGFDGLLMTDDLSMKALGGSFADRTALSFQAGCDIALHCNGQMAEMAEILAATPRLEGRSADRADRALSRIETISAISFDRQAAWDKLGAILDQASA